MKQRFAVALLAVAIASLSASAYAIAPVINDFRSPVIADDTPATNSNEFVYPDAFNLDNQASDPDSTVTPGNIIWSYTGDGTYRINNRDQMTLPADDPNAPGAKGLAAGDDPNVATHGGDANVRTITLRNNALSPVGGPFIDPPGTRIIPAQTKAVTVFASDGSTYTMSSFLVYTDDGGIDMLSGVTIEPVIPTTIPSNAGTSAWTTTVIPGLEGITFSASATNGLCLQTPAAGEYFAGWTSPYGIMSVNANYVYRIRIEVDGIPAIPVSQTPLWDFVLDNVAPSAAQQKFSADYFFWDTHQGANSLDATVGRSSFDIWWAPIPVSVTDWNDATNGQYRAANDASNDARFAFRLIDTTSVVDGQNDSGTVCLKTYTVDRILISDLDASGTVFDLDAIDSTNTHLKFLNIAGATNIAYAGGNATLTPASTTAWDLEVVTLEVGTDSIDFNNPASLPDNWPIDWVSNQLLMYTAGVQAPNALGQTNPADAIRLVMDTPTSEISAESLVSSGANLLGLPKTAAAETYTMFFHTGNKTLNNTANFDGVRPRFGLFFQPAISSGGVFGATNQGGITVTFMKVETIDTSGF